MKHTTFSKSSKLGLNCYAFEPVSFVGLEENVKLNNLDNMITTYPIGIGSKKKRVTFNVMKLLKVQVILIDQKARAIFR